MSELFSARVIPDNGGPYASPVDDEKYYYDLAMARDDGLKWVHPCTSTVPKLDVESILEPLLDNMHEDAEFDDFKGVQALEKAVVAFNGAQTCKTYFADSTRKIAVRTGGKDA